MVAALLAAPLLLLGGCAKQHDWPGSWLPFATSGGYVPPSSAADAAVPSYEPRAGAGYGGAAPPRREHSFPTWLDPANWFLDEDYWL